MRRKTEYSSQDCSPQAGKSTLDEQLASQPNLWFDIQRTSLLSQFTPYLVHDVIQPLSTICNFSETLLRKIAAASIAQSQLSDALTVINKEAFRASDILKNLRVGANTNELVLVSVHELLQQTLEFSSGFLHAEQVKLSTTFTEELPLVSANPARLQQVILNLIHNAAVAMRALPRESREIRIASRVHTGSLEIAVDDDGPPLPKETYASLMQPFFTTKNSALGLGLWASRKIVEQYCGELLLRPKVPRGLQAIMRLPFAADSKALPAPFQE
jgi:C4-dicarboxylate-specific signal transduction histidine kinase